MKESNDLFIVSKIWYMRLDGLHLNPLLRWRAWRGWCWSIKERPTAMGKETTKTTATHYHPLHCCLLQAAPPNLLESRKMCIACRQRWRSWNGRRNQRWQRWWLQTSQEGSMGETSSIRKTPFLEESRKRSSSRRYKSGELDKGQMPKRSVRLHQSWKDGSCTTGFRRWARGNSTQRWLRMFSNETWKHYHRTNGFVACGQKMAIYHLAGKTTYFFMLVTYVFCKQFVCMYF